MALNNHSHSQQIPSHLPNHGAPIPRTAVRKIPRSAVSLTGRLASVRGFSPQAFESSLERDLLILLDSDPSVDHYQVQPVKILFQDALGNARSYTPDIFVAFKPDPLTGMTRKPLLIEVKPRRCLARKWPQLRQKFKAAINHANGQGWRFIILTEQEIRVPGFLDNLLYLRGFINRTPDSQWAVAILDAILKQKGQACTICQLMEKVCRFPGDQGLAMPIVWHLVATRKLWTDLRVPLTNESVVRHALQPDPAFLWGTDGPPLRRRLTPVPEPVPTCSPIVQPLLSIASGSRVMVEGRPGVILKVIDLREVLVRDDATGLPERVRIDSLGPFILASPKPRLIPDLAAVPDAAWTKALKRDAVIRPLLIGRRTHERIEQATKEAGVSRVTIYRWLGRFLDSGERASSLIPQKPSGGRHKSRLPEKVEAILQKVLDDYFLTGQKMKIAPTIREVELRCKAAGIKPPHGNTIRKRIEWIPEERKVRRRFGAKAADHLFRVVSGSFPNADWPLAVVQIDHTPLDIILVNELGRECVGRPWLTVVIDIYSRMVLGYYVSLDPPGDISTGLCLSQAILPKDEWLRSHDVQVEWPCWGLPGTVHADNAKEFRGNMLQMAAREYGFNLEWRVLGKPQYGGHIERWLGSLAREIHTLLGTTFSSVADRGSYKSTKKAVFTLKELEVWLANHILGQYHHSKHSGLEGDTPLERYEKGIFGRNGALCRGLPDRIGNEAKLRMDFLPYFERTVQHHGIEIDGITYFHPVLRTFQDERDPATRKLKREFIVRRDPRDISVVYLLDPKTQSYLDIPYRDASHPPISIWEWRATLPAKKDGASNEINEELRFQAIEKMRAVEREAARCTTTARRNVERRKRNEELNLHGRKAKKGASDRVEAPATKPAKARSPKPVIPLRTTPIKAFDGIE